MIAGWLIYCVAISTLFAAGAAAVDSLLTARGRAARWVWVGAMAMSLGLPAAAYWEQTHRRPPTSGWTEREMAGLNEQFPLNAQSRASAAIPVPRPRAPEVLGADRVVVLIAITCILFAAARVVFDSILLYRGRHQWRAHTIDGESVLVSDELGPAIVGLLQPRIVLPRWTLALPPQERSLILTHEREHVRAHDGRLTTAALIAVVSMPWNPAMWYVLRRLRTAIEVDCDRRVLRAFPDVRRYGQLLVDVAQRSLGSSMAIAGFSERAAPLARRIHAMSQLVRRRISPLDAAPGAVGALTLVGAFVLLPPEAAPTWTMDRRPNEVVMAKYVGDSIADGESPPKLVAAARDLPAEFSVAEMGPIPAGQTQRDCPQRLRDDRDGTRLIVRLNTSAAAGAMQHGDTTWRRSRNIGYYGVSPAGRYGVGEEQLLRVGCGGRTRIDVAGKPVDLDALSTLDSRDDRARRIAKEVQALIHVEPMAVDLFQHKLRVVVGDTAAVDADPKAPRDFTRELFGRVRAVLGEAAMPETLAVTVRRGRSTWITNYYYNSMEK